MRGSVHYVVTIPTLLVVTIWGVMIWAAVLEWR